MTTVEQVVLLSEEGRPTGVAAKQTQPAATHLTPCNHLILSLP